MVELAEALKGSSYGGMWTDGATYGDAPNNPVFWSMRDRVLVGAAADATNLTRGWYSHPWFPSGVSPIPGANWSFRDASFAVGSPRGLSAIVGMSRTSDKTTSGSTGGGMFFGVTNSGGGFSRAGYFESQLNAVAGHGWSQEIVSKDVGTTALLALGTYGAYGGSHRQIGTTYNAGGDPQYGGHAHRPPDAAVVIGSSFNYPQAAIATVVRAGNVVTATFASQFLAEVGTGFTVSGVSDPSFNGSVTILTLSANKLTATWAQVAADASSTGGSIILTDRSAYTWQKGVVFLSGGLTDGKALETYQGTSIGWVCSDGTRGAVLQAAGVTPSTGFTQTFGAGSVSWLDFGGVARFAVNSSGATTAGTLSAQTGIVGGGTSVASFTGLNQISAIGSGNAGVAVQIGASGTGRFGFGTSASYLGGMSYVASNGAGTDSLSLALQGSDRIRLLAASFAPVTVGVSLGTVANPWSETVSTLLRLTGLAVYADNAAAISGGLVAGQVYRTSTGAVNVCY